MSKLLCFLKLHSCFHSSRCNTDTHLLTRVSTTGQWSLSGSGPPISPLLPNLAMDASPSFKILGNEYGDQTPQKQYNAQLNPFIKLLK